MTATKLLRRLACCDCALEAASPQASAAGVRLRGMEGVEVEGQGNGQR